MQSVPYIQSPVPPQMQPTPQNVYMSSEQQMYQYPANQQSYIRSVPQAYQSENLLQFSPYQPYIRSHIIQYNHAAGRGTKDKDKEENELDRSMELRKGCITRGMFPDSLGDDLKVIYFYSIDARPVSSC